MMTFESVIKARLKELGVKYVEYDKDRIVFAHPSAGMCEIKFIVKKVK